MGGQTTSFSRPWPSNILRSETLAHNPVRAMIRRTSGHCSDANMYHRLPPPKGAQNSDECRNWSGRESPPRRHRKLALGSINAVLEIVHQGVCLPIYLNPAASVDGWRFVTSVPEHQNARQQFLNWMAPPLSQISRIPPCTADSLVPPSFLLSKSIRKTYSK